MAGFHRRRRAAATPRPVLGSTSEGRTDRRRSKDSSPEIGCALCRSGRVTAPVVGSRRRKRAATERSWRRGAMRPHVGTARRSCSRLSNRRLLGLPSLGSRCSVHKWPALRRPYPEAPARDRMRLARMEGKPPPTRKPAGKPALRTMPGFLGQPSLSH
jgi:hypothetical protein